MVNFQGKLWGEGPPKRVWIVWTAGWVEPVDKWMITIIHLSAAPNPLVGNRRGGTFSRAHLMIQKLQKWSSFWIQKQQKYCSFWIKKLWIWTNKFLDPEMVEMVRFLDPETADILQFLDPEIVKLVWFLDQETAEILQFLDPEIVKIDKKNSGSRNHRNGVIPWSRNCRKGRQILYGLLL